MADVSGIATTLADVLGKLNPVDLANLGHRLSNSDQMKALQILTTMQANPALAPALLPSLSTIPNLPPRVMSWVTGALSNPANFQQSMMMAVDALQSEATKPSLFGHLRSRTSSST